jgi:phosphoserine aminotransferase
MSRKYNFYAGPSTLPLPVLEEIREEMVDYRGHGLSMIETSHRSKEYDAVHTETIDLLRELMAVPDDHSVMFMGGGATLQFAMVPLNFMPATGSCDIVLSGSWAEKAVKDAEKVGNVRIAFDGSDSGYTTLPSPSEVEADSRACYFHLTSNETISGVQWKSFPDTGDVPLIADMSSDIASRPLDVSQFDLVYAGAQKNIGPAGVTVVIIKNSLLECAADSLPAYLSYKTHAEKNSLYNTPPVFSVYAMNKVLRWLKENGGVEAAAKRNEQKAQAIYDAIAGSGGFYNCPVDEGVRSTMNVVFRTRSEDLDKQFIAEAEKEGMLGLKGHRSVGGIRASLYNAMPQEGAQALADFMKSFAQKNG